MPSVDLNGVRVHYEILGEGEPIAFLNGVMMTARSWVLQTALFRSHFRCILHDFRGQLLSDKPARAWRLEDHAADLKALLDYLEIERCHLVGTSYGGEVGMVFASECPDRVKSLSVISAVSEVGPELDDAVSTWKEVALTKPEELYRVAIPFNFSPSFVAANPAVIELGEERLRGCPADFFPAFARLVDAFRELDITARLERIECPTLVLVGEDDLLKPPRYSRLIAANIVDSEFLLIPGAGHAVIIEKPGEINTALLGFIDKHHRGQRSASSARRLGADE